MPFSARNVRAFVCNFWGSVLVTDGAYEYGILVFYGKCVLGFGGMAFNGLRFYCRDSASPPPQPRGDVAEERGGGVTVVSDEKVSGVSFRRRFGRGRWKRRQCASVLYIECATKCLVCRSRRITVSCAHGSSGCGPSFDAALCPSMLLSLFAFFCFVSCLSFCGCFGGHRVLVPGRVGCMSYCTCRACLRKSFVYIAWLCVA